jgi:CubicO group peptidase (beta-lactamase class C family)
MSKLITWLLALFICVTTATSQNKTYNKKLDAMIAQGMEDWKIPGLAAIVVKDQKVVFSKTYGVKNLQTKDPVDENTLFNMASTTKAVVCMAMGILVDQGKLDWNGKVRDYLPSFQLSDPYITEEARIKDLLTHNLGIAGADMLWAIDSASTQETISRFRMAKKAYPIRGGYAYNNLMYAIAGEVISQVSGEHWTSFVKKNILDPLDMKYTKAKSVELFENGNYATPYLDDFEDGIIQTRYTLSDQIGAAGMIWSCASDIENYLTYLTNDGVYNADTILSRTTFDYLFQPQAFVTRAGFYPTQLLTKPNWTTYGLGWFQHDYKGSKLDFHTGSISGLIAIAGIIRDKNVAVYVFANMDHAELRHAILYKAMDLYAFNDDSRDWHKEVFELYDGFKKQAIEAAKAEEENRVPDTNPSLDLSEYAGEYQHEMLGTIIVETSTDGLTLDINGS